MREYYLITSGYHCAGVLTHFLRTRKNDFIEMGLHHIIALYLFGGGYMLNAWEAGAVIAFLHDIADIFTSLIKVMAETKYIHKTAQFFPVCMLIWFYTRIFLLPQFIYTLYTEDSIEFHSPLIRYYLCFMLLCLTILHCHWFLMFCRIYKKFLDFGIAEDEQEKTEISSDDDSSSQSSNAPHAAY